MSTPTPKKQYWREYPHQKTWVLLLPHKYSKRPIIVLRTPNTDRDWAAELRNNNYIVVQQHTDDFWTMPDKHSLILILEEN